MPGNQIEMLDNTWGGDKRRLGRGTIHRVPDEVSVPDAEKLVDKGLAKWVGQAVPPVVSPEIIEAINRLDKTNPEHFTASGKPQVKALEAVLGRPVTAAERDAAMDSLK